MLILGYIYVIIFGALVTHQICDMIKENESDVADIVEILAKKEFKILSFYIVFSIDKLLKRVSKLKIFTMRLISLDRVQSWNFHIFPEVQNCPTL